MKCVGILSLAKKAAFDPLSIQVKTNANCEPVNDVINNDGDMYTVLDVLAKKVGISGIFSDWPATVTYYANCMGL